MDSFIPAIGMGQFAEFAAAVVRNLPRDIDPVTAQKWIREQGALGIALRETLVSPAMQRKQYVLRVDGTASLTALIADGNYDEVLFALCNRAEQEMKEAAEGKQNSSDAPAAGILETTAELICFGCAISIKEAKSTIQALGLRNANIREILSFGAQYPDVQRTMRIGGLDARVGGFDHVWRVQWGYYLFLAGDETRRVIEGVDAEIYYRGEERAVPEPMDRILVLAA